MKPVNTYIVFYYSNPAKSIKYEITYESKEEDVLFREVEEEVPF
jgi:hypothetical protein